MAGNTNEQRILAALHDRPGLDDELSVAAGVRPRQQVNQFAMIIGHMRWIELAWLSIAASLLAIVISEIWPLRARG